jgi:hypothetical protein
VPADRDPSLIGHTSAAFQCGWIVNRVPIFRSREGGISCGTPSSPELDGEGRVKTWSDGKRESGQRAVLGALADVGIGAGAA